MTTDELRAAQFLRDTYHRAASTQWGIAARPNYERQAIHAIGKVADAAASAFEVLTGRKVYGVEPYELTPSNPAPWTLEVGGPFGARS